MASRQEEKERRRRERQEAEQAAAKSASRKRTLQIGGAVVLVTAVIVVIGIVALAGGGGSSTPDTSDLAADATAAGCTFKSFKSEGRNHTTGKVTYKTNPPTSGNHNPTPAQHRLYAPRDTREPQPDAPGGRPRRAGERAEPGELRAQPRARAHRVRVQEGHAAGPGG